MTSSCGRNRTIRTDTYGGSPANRARFLGEVVEAVLNVGDACRVGPLLSTPIRRTAATAPDPNITFGDFLEGTAVPFLRSKWKGSTRDTTENRIRHHLLAEFGEEKLARLTLKGLQGFLAGKAATLSRSVVAHLRWDLRAIFRLALAEGYVERDPTPALFTPKEAKVGIRRVMNRKEAEQHINALPLRERVIDHLALFTGMRSGEILALQRRHIARIATS